MTTEPIHKNTPVVHHLPDGRQFTIYASGSVTFEDMTLDGWDIEVNGHIATAQELERGWLDMDELR